MQSILKVIKLYLALTLCTIHHANAQEHQVQQDGMIKQKQLSTNTSSALNASLGGDPSIIPDKTPAPSPAPSKKTALTKVDATVYIAGDSTAATYAEASQQRGWGQQIRHFFDGRVHFENLAIGGRSTKAYSGDDWSRLLNRLKTGDYVLIQFGHNDSHKASDLESTKLNAYKTHLRTFVADTRSKGAKPILITPTHRRSFNHKGMPLPYLTDAKGQPMHNLAPYAAATKAVATSENVPCVDLFALSGEFLASIGDDRAKHLFAPGDRTHWNQQGATRMAALLTRGISQSDSGLQAYIRDGALEPELAPLPKSIAAKFRTTSQRDFPLVESGIAATLVHSAEDAKVVEIATNLFAEDVQRVTGIRPSQKGGFEGVRGPLVLIGTLGKSPLIDGLVARGAIDVSSIKGGWEQYRIEVVKGLSPQIPQALVIAGSDPRGTAFAVFEMSRLIGVSPWYWWADVPARKAKDLLVKSAPMTSREPAVRYRGIFINDETWGLRPWAQKTYEPEKGNMGPKTYAKIFELMLRLRANTIWPAMHPGTTPFHQMPGNADIADDYAIVLGSCHAEPMLRNNVGEWKLSHEKYNFSAHPKLILDYWEQRVKERTRGESLFTIGMRGIHDGPMLASKDQAVRIKTLEQIFTEQRKLLAHHLGNGDPTKIGQIFVPYKEVLSDYHAGLHVPDDVTIVLPDDNFGYIRRFPSELEAARPGGCGVYYHVSYLGPPLSYLWIDHIPVTLTWAEMVRLYEQGARKVWIVNVGDIKNTERTMEYFLDLAVRADNTTPDDSLDFLRRTAERDFGPQEAASIFDISRRLQAINFERKAEHLRWHLINSPYAPTELNDREIAQRLKDCAQLLADSDAVLNRLPQDARDAYFQLVHYPVAITAAANDYYFNSELARLQLARGDETLAEKTFSVTEPAMERMKSLTAYYNKELCKGKWEHIVHPYGIINDKFYTVTPVPPLHSPAQKAVKAYPIAPEPGPLPRPEGARKGDFVERDGVVSIHAGNFTGSKDLPCGAGWRSVPGLGRSATAVTVLPSTANIDEKNAPTLDYRFHVKSGGKPTIQVRLVPNAPLAKSSDLKFALSIDDGSPKTLQPNHVKWDFRVLANATNASITFDHVLEPGWHTLRLTAVDAGVVVDKIVVEFKAIPPSYNGPEETRLMH